MRKRTIGFILASLAALAIAGLAVAGRHGAETDAVAATFSATEVKRMKSRTCTGADGEYRITHAVLLGEVVSTTDPLLAGKLKLHLKSVYNVAESIGWVAGTAHIRNEAADPDTRARASFRAVNVGGEIEGLFTGGAGRPHWKLLANFSAKLADTGVTEGQIGGGSSDNSALVFRGGCRSEAAPAAQERKLEREDKGRGHEKKRP